MDRTVIFNDIEAEKILRHMKPKTQFGETMKTIAILTAKHHSFVANQTYPRPGHHNPVKRLDALFTFCAVIISLRCTLETEVLVTNKLIEYTNGNSEKLLLMSPLEYAEIIQPSGMANKKSQWIVQGLPRINQIITSKSILTDTDSLRRELLNIQGVGPKAADCFILLGLNLPVFPIDVNIFKLTVKSVPFFIESDMSFNKKKDVEKIKNFYENEFKKEALSYQILHAYLLLANKHNILG